MDEQNKNEREIPVICQRIRYYREKKGMEQRALARELGIISNAVSNWENGRAKPPVSSLPQISQILGVTLEELFGMPAPAPSEETKPGIRMTTRKLTSIDSVLLEKFHGLNKLHQSFVDAGWFRSASGGTPVDYTPSDSAYMEDEYDNYYTCTRCTNVTFQLDTTTEDGKHDVQTETYTRFCFGTLLGGGSGSLLRTALRCSDGAGQCRPRASAFQQ